MAEGKKSFKDIMRSIWAVIKRYAKRFWEYVKVAKMELIVMISLFALDLISKAIVNAAMSEGQVFTLIPKFLNINNIHNYHAAFGASWMTSWLGALGARLVYCLFAVATSVVFIIILVRHKNGSKMFRVSLAMLTAGAMGNCIDRWALGYVRDFIEFVYFGGTIFGRKSFWVFNFADAELVIGVIVLFVFFLFFYKDKDKDVEAKNKQVLEGGKKPAAADSDGEDAPEAEADAPDGQIPQPEPPDIDIPEPEHVAEGPELEKEPEPIAEEPAPPEVTGPDDGGAN